MIDTKFIWESEQCNYTIYNTLSTKNIGAKNFGGNIFGGKNFGELLPYFGVNFGENRKKFGGVFFWDF